LEKKTAQDEVFVILAEAAIKEEEQKTLQDMSNHNKKRTLSEHAQQ
jgi:hypothetical protein